MVLFVGLLRILSRVSDRVFIEFSFLHFENWNLSFVILLDIFSSIFIICVRIIRIAVLKFRQSYIINDKYFMRFHVLLILFVSRIYILILSPNLVRILLGWDGLGLTSYLLVIYYRNSKAYNSGIITAISNRVGDALILVRIRFLVIFGNWNIYFYINKELSLLIGILLIIAACTKSAQLPFSAWLPAAIAAPTPVSSLVHSSTLVTAGIYLLIRHNSLFLKNNISVYLMIIGIMTMILASLRALFEIDLKKIVALSTLRQLGVIILRLGLGAFIARFFHLLRHAFFKALIFISTGNIIHNRKDYQDLRLVGGRVFTLPITNRFILISSIRLIGIPFISAFFSKEMILDFLLIENFNIFVYLIIILGIFLTASYRTRFIIYVFTRFTHNLVTTFKNDEDNFIIKRITFLLLPARLTGFWGRLILWESVKTRRSLIIIKVMVLAILFLGRLIFILKISKDRKNSWNFFYWRLRRMWCLPFIRSQIPVRIFSDLRNTVPKIFDRGILISFVSHLNLFFLQRIFNSLSIKLIYKIIFIVALWWFAFVLYYLCISIQNEAFEIKIVIKIFEIINSLKTDMYWAILKILKNLTYVKVKNAIIK